MARIRTIKPEFFRHEGLFELEQETGLSIRIAFAGLWTACDREGRFKWTPKTLKLDCLPFDECDFGRVLDALCTRGFIVKYESDGREFGFIPSWGEHQVVNNRESPSSLPNPQDCSIKSIASTREARVDDTCATPLEQDQGEGKGREGKGREQEGKEINPALRARREQVAAVFDCWRQTMGHPKAALDDKRRRLVEARLKDGYTQEALCKAIIGCSKSPFHMGSNERGARYDGLDLILRDGAKVDQFIGFDDSPPKPQGKQAQIEAINQSVVDEFVHGRSGHYFEMEAGHD